MVRCILFLSNGTSVSQQEIQVLSVFMECLITFNRFVLMHVYLLANSFLASSRHGIQRFFLSGVDLKTLESQVAATYRTCWVGLLS
jgi:hypothetical protein